MSLFTLKSLARQPDPFPAFAQLRETDPVHWDVGAKGWILTRYEHVRVVMRGSQYSSDRLRPFFDTLPEEARAALPDLSSIIPLWLVFRGGADHTRLRTVMNPAFIMPVIRALRPRVEQLVDELIDGMSRQAKPDFIRDFGLPLPGYVICDLLGIPREDLPNLRKWSDELNLFIGGARVTENKYERAQEGTRSLVEYFRRVVEQRRKKPGADFVSTLVEKSAVLSEDEIISTSILMLFGGHETTTNLLGNGFLSLVQHPAARAKLRANPDLAASAVEECLRFDGPGGAVVRIVTEDHEIEDRKLQAGQRVFAMVPAANRDPLKFLNPDTFDIERKDNPHLTFGSGIHFCLGAPLARLEAAVALPRLMDRLGDIRIELPNAQLDWRDATVMRGLHSLPITFSNQSTS